MNWRCIQMALVSALWSVSALAVGTDELASSGVWKALKSGDSFADVGAAGAGRLALVRPDGSSHFVLRLSHPGWHIQPGAAISLHFIFTGGDAFLFPAAGSGGVIQADMSDDQVASWTHNFTAMKTMAISFEGLSESPWIMSLTGTTPTVTAMAKAMEAGGVTGLPWPWSQTAPAQSAIPDSPALPSASAEANPTQASQRATPLVSSATAARSPTESKDLPASTANARPVYHTIIPVEQDAVIYDEMIGNSALLDEMVRLVLSNDYKCDSISAARPLIFSNGFELTCNRYRYEYDIHDKGGHWIVTVD
jgi:hypothetical protein